MKLIKKKVDIQELNEEFQEEIRLGAEKLYDYLFDFIENDLQKIDDHFQEIIECEKKCDRLKENYIKVLFEDKRALPFLIEDRYKLVIYLDKILNKYEILARYIQVYPFKIYEDIQALMKEFIQLNLESINQLLNCTLLMETDFNAAYELTFEVEKHKRDAFDLKFKILDIIFQKKEEKILKVNLTWKLVSLIYDAISWAEEISDFLRGLIIKYPNK